VQEQKYLTARPLSKKSPPKATRRSWESDTLKVVTVREASLMFYRVPSTIYWHINRGNLVWRQTADRTYLISLESLIAMYGTPIRTRGECVPD
jgi:hypothetical protein